MWSRIVCCELSTLTLTLNTQQAFPGDHVSLLLSGQSGGATAANVGDVYLAAIIPDGTIFTNDGTQWRPVTGGVAPFRQSVDVSTLAEEVFSGNMPDSLPSGVYTFVAVLVKPGADPADGQNWLSPLAVTSLTYVNTPPAPPPSTPPPAVTLSATPPSVQIGQNIGLTWSVANATSCTASGNWSGPRSNTGGSESINVGQTPGSRTYVLSCSGPGGSAGASVVVSVTAPPTSVQCDPVSAGDRVLEIENDLSTGIAVFLPQFAFEDDIRPGPNVCDAIGLLVFDASFTVIAEITQCNNSGQNSECSSTFGPTRTVNIPLKLGETRRITVGSGFFN